jgi:hypothetical protein
MRSYVRSTLAGLVVTALGLGAVHAQSALSGLGQAWPNATDVSASPNYHVYVFQRGTTRYIQVNDATGKVRGAVARTPYSLIGTPVGSDATNVSTPDEPLAAPASTAGETVYKDDAVQIYVAPQADGTMRIMAVSSECTNPRECNAHGP